MKKKIGYWKWLYNRYKEDLKFVATVLSIIGSIILALLFCYGVVLLMKFIENYHYDSLDLSIQILLTFISFLSLSLLIAYIFIKSYKKYEKENPELIV